MSATPPNLVLITIDSLRADHCGFAGDDRGLTPAIDRLAADGVGFRTAVAPGPQTFSSMPTAFTGVHWAPNPHLEGDDDRSWWGRRLDAVDAHLRDYAPIPERLRRRGYATAAVSANPWTGYASGFDRGFDRFLDRSDPGDDGRLTGLAARVPGVDEESRTVELALNLLTDSSFFSQWETFYDDLLGIVEDLPEPFFLWVFLLDTHNPYVVAREHRVENSTLGTYYGTLRAQRAIRHGGTVSDRVLDLVRRSYRDAVRSTDAFVDRLTEDLGAADPVFVVHADHGESLGERGNLGHQGHVYEENVHVPLVVGGAGSADPVDDPVSLDALPSLFETLARGDSFDPAALTEPYVATANEDGTHRAVRGRRFKYLRSNGEPALFDLQRDPGEETDLSAERRGLTRTLRDYLAGVDRHRDERRRIRRGAARLVAPGGF